ncbi:hypothetical protein [Winogradskyella sp. A3E31]|uniref:hypothetical protein n=1 Tax=Winogradskyella sp. A3E31 TaxID=3349637 RepID=UPI00398B5414
MLNIKSIIETFSAEEQIQFSNYLESKNKRNDTKNVELFKLLSKEDLNSKEICQKLYGKQNRPAYHALRNRLFNSLIDFTANKNLEGENSVDMQIIKYLLASRSFLLQKNYKVAFKLLDKAENLADEHSLFPILNEIYHTKIQYSHTFAKADINDLILKQQQNRIYLQHEDDLNIIYSKLKSILNDINRKGEIINIEATLKTLLAEHNITLNDSLSYKSLYQLLSIFDVSAYVTKDYSSIRDFAIECYDILNEKKNLVKQVHYRIHCLYIIANTHFRNRLFTESMDYINEMEELIHQNRGNLLKDFKLKITLIKALNLNYTNNQEDAIILIESIKDKNHSDIESLLDLKLCLAMFYFQNEELKKAKSIISKFYHTDEWYKDKAGLDWVIKKNLVEILLYLEMNEDDLYTSRIRSFRRKYSLYLKESNQDNILYFLKLVGNFYKNGYQLEDTYLISITTNDLSKVDIFTLSFHAWIRSKIENENLYKTTINLLNSN